MNIELWPVYGEQVWRLDADLLQRHNMQLVNRAGPAPGEQVWLIQPTGHPADPAPGAPAEDDQEVAEDDQAAPADNAPHPTRVHPHAPLGAAAGWRAVGARHVNAPLPDQDNEPLQDLSSCIITCQQCQPQRVLILEWLSQYC